MARSSNSKQGLTLDLSETAMSKRIEQILRVLAETRRAGGGVRQRIDAEKKVAHKARDISHKTVHSKIVRELGLSGVEEFDRLVHCWLSGSPDELKHVLHNHVVTSDDKRCVEEFFAPDRR